MSSGPAPAAYDRTPVLVGAAVAILIALASAVDFRGVVNDVPAVPPPCVPAAAEACNAARNSELQARIARAGELEDDFENRAWLYGAGALAAVLAGAGVAFSRAGAGLRRELFTDLGVAGVLWLIAGFLLVTAAEGEIIGVPSKPILYPGIALLLVAAAGTLLSRRAAPGEAPARKPPRGGPAVRAIGFGCTAIAVVCSAIVLASRGDPCVDEVSGAVDTMVAIAWITAGVAVLAGIASLIQRRWFAALIMLTAGPFCALLAALTAACWN